MTLFKTVDSSLRASPALRMTENRPPRLTKVLSKCDSRVFRGGYFSQNLSFSIFTFLIKTKLAITTAANMPNSSR